MSIENLDRVFHPRAVAVVGASERQGSIGHAIMQNLLNGEYRGEVYPVNPSHNKILNLPTYSSLGKITSDVDLAVITTPIQKAPEIVAACAEKGVGGAVIISAGGKEVGEKGREIEKAILEAASPSGVRIIGPNCLGIISSKGALNASFANRSPQPGKMAFISQSGGICTAVLDMSLKEQMGFSYFVSLGSMLDVNFADMIDYLGGEADVSSIVMYVENLTRFRSFMSAARAVSRVKPIIALKVGRSRAGAAAASSHTGAMAGEYAVYEAAFKRAGIIQVKTFEELFDCAEFVAKQPRLKGPGLAILTNSGGPGVMAADALSDYGIEPVAFSPETIERLNAILPVNWSRSNPVDMLGDADEKTFMKAIQICRDAREIDGLLVMLAPDAVNDPTVVARSLVASIQNKSFPISAVWLGGPVVDKGRDIFNQAGIPTFDSPERAIRAFMDLYQYTKNIEMLHEIPPRFPRKLEFQTEEIRPIIAEKLDKEQYQMTEVEAKSLLARYGIPVNRTQTAGSLDDAVQVAWKMGFPVAMKVNSRDITHKTDADGVCLNITSDEEIARAYQQIISSARCFCPDAIIDGVTVQPMVQRPDHELILGVKKDRDFGPVILFGTGGTYTEVLKDRAIGLPPLNRLLAKKLMARTTIYKILKGIRGHAPVDLVKLEEMLIRLSQLVSDFPQIDELDINPLFVSGSRILAVDARILLTPVFKPAPDHMVISSYPADQEYRTVIDESVGEVLIRPIRPEDAPLLTDLFNLLSKQSVYNRFFSPLKRLPHDMLARFTQIDYDREIALVAIQGEAGNERMLGVARILKERGGEKAEFAVLGGDPWQGRGIGSRLLSRCLALAKTHKIQEVWGIVLAENNQMLTLGYKLGFKIKREQRGSEYILRCDLQAIDN